MSLSSVPFAFFERLSKNQKAKVVPGMVAFFSEDGSCYVNAGALGSGDLIGLLQEFWNLDTLEGDGGLGYALLDQIEDMTSMGFADFVLDQWDKKQERRDLVQLAHRVDDWLSTIPRDWPGAFPGYDSEWLRNVFSVVYAVTEQKGDCDHALIRAIEAVFMYGYQQGRENRA